MRRAPKRISTTRRTYAKPIEIPLVCHELRFHNINLLGNRLPLRLELDFLIGEMSRKNMLLTCSCNRKVTNHVHLISDFVSRPVNRRLMGPFPGLMFKGELETPPSLFTKKKKISSISSLSICSLGENTYGKTRTANLSCDQAWPPPRRF